MSDINIFISYKHDFKDSVVKIRDAIRYVDTDNKIGLFMDDGISAGTKWFDWIKQHIGESNILLFIYSEPSSKWDWCLFEAGMFLGTGDNTRRVICIHHPDSQPPDQLQDLQSNPANEKTIQELLVDLFTKTNITNLKEPLYPDVTACWGNICTSAKVICKEIPKVIERLDYDKFINVEIQNIDKITGSLIPTESIIESTLESMEIFGLEKKQLSWGEFLQTSTELGDQRWITELQDIISTKAVKRKKFNPVHATLSAWDGTTYLPVLSTAEFFSNNSVKFNVHFVEDVSSKIMELPTTLGVLQTCIRLGTRFRYEVLLKCKAFVNEPHTEEEIKNNYKITLNAIDSVEKEAKSRGSLSMEAIVIAFAKPSEQASVQSMLLGWPPLKEKLMGKLADGRLEEAKAFINELIALNSEFLLLAAERYHQLLKGLLAGGE